MVRGAGFDRMGAQPNFDLGPSVIDAGCELCLSYAATRMWDYRKGHVASRERLGSDPCELRERLSADGQSNDAFPLELNRVVETPRCACSSIACAVDCQPAVSRNLSEKWFRCADR